MGKDKYETRVARVLSLRCPDSYKELFNELFFLKKKKGRRVVSLPEGPEFLAEARRMLTIPPSPHPPLGKVS